MAVHALRSDEAVWQDPYPLWNDLPEDEDDTPVDLEAGWDKDAQEASARRAKQAYRKISV